MLIDKAFSVPKCVRLARMSNHSHQLLRKMLGAVPGDQREDLSEIWGEDFLSLEKKNASDFERQNTIEKTTNNAQAVDRDVLTQARMVKFESLLEASGELNLRIINLKHGECPCHCLAQRVWYTEQSNLCLICDVEKFRSIGLPDHQQKVTLFVVSSMLALRWIEEKVTKYRGRRHQRWNRYMRMTIAGGLSCLRLRAKYSLYPWR